MKLLPLGLLGAAIVQASDEEAAWQTFETVEDEIDEIEQDLKDYQQVGICGSTHISPNEWLFQNAKTRRSSDDDIDETINFNQFERIVGGKEAKAHSWPWIAFLDFGRKWCGGTIIHPKYVITAVHCVHKESLPRIILGAHDKTHTDGSIIVKAKKITLYPEFYKPVDYNNDIAIIELEEPVQFNDQIKPLCLPPTDSYLDPEKPGTVCVAAGWGADSFKKSSYPNALHEVDINLIERKVCNQIPGYENMVTNKMFCAGHLEGGKDTCQGDSGGPLMCKLIGPGNPWILYGVTSWGIGCAQAYTPGVYVKVSKFVDWIEKETGVKPSIQSGDYFNLDAVEPKENFPNEHESNVVDAAYFTQNIQTQADSWEFQHHIQEQKICGGEMWGPAGTIESDGYPYRYPARQYCKWKITARDPKNLIVLKFRDIQLDSETECILNDHIMVFDHYNQIVGTPQCKLAKKTVWTVTGRRYVTIYFNTNEQNEVSFSNSSRKTQIRETDLIVNFKGTRFQGRLL